MFEVALDDIEEVHLHPADMRGAIVSLSQPDPAASWRWGGPGWAERSAAVSLAGARVGVADPSWVGRRWRAVIGELPGVSFVSDDGERGPIEILLAGGVAAGREPIEVAGVRFTLG